MGHLSWFALLDPEEQEGYVGQITIGSVFTRSADNLVNPAGMPISPPIDHVTLYLGEYTISLSQLVQQVEALAQRLEVAVATAISEQVPEEDQGTTLGSDLSVFLKVRLGQGDAG
jgi:hypothetical protein